MNVKKRYVKNQKVSLYTELLYETYDPSKTCILIAGAGAPAYFWTDEFCHKLIDSGISVLRFDHRDQGLSSPVNWDLHPYTVDDLSKDVISILDAYEIKKTHAVGHSMGGTISQWLAITTPKRLYSYISMSVSTCGLKHQVSKEAMEVLLKNKPTQNYERDLEGFMRSWKLLNGDFNLDQAMATMYTKDLYTRSKHKVDVAWHHIWAQKDFQNLSHKLGSINVPGLFIHGDKDVLASLEGAKKTQGLTPLSQLCIIKGMGHMIFNTALQKNLAKQLIHFHNQHKEEI